MEENLPVVEMFFLKRDYINLILGKECNNFLSPTHFFCGCQKNMLLGGFNKITTIIKEMRHHAKNEDQSCKVFMRRHNHMIKSLADQRREAASTSAPTPTDETSTNEASALNLTEPPGRWGSQPREYM